MAREDKARYLDEMKNYTPPTASTSVVEKKKTGIVGEKKKKDEGKSSGMSTEFIVDSDDD